MNIFLVEWTLAGRGGEHGAEGRTKADIVAEAGSPL